MNSTLNRESRQRDFDDNGHVDRVAGIQWQLDERVTPNAQPVPQPLRLPLPTDTPAAPALADQLQCPYDPELWMLLPAIVRNREIRKTWLLIKPRDRDAILQHVCDAIGCTAKSERMAVLTLARIAQGMTEGAIIDSVYNDDTADGRPAFPTMPEELAVQHGRCAKPGLEQLTDVPVPHKSAALPLLFDAAKAVGDRILAVGGHDAMSRERYNQLMNSVGTHETAVRPAEPFPLDLLPDAFREYVDIHARSLGVPHGPVALSLLTTAGSVIGVRLAIDAAAPGWMESACLWTGLVGASGDKKTPTLRTAAAPLEMLEYRDKLDYDRRKERHKRDKAAYNAARTATVQTTNERTGETRRVPITDGASLASEPRLASRRRHVVVDITLPKLHMLLETNRGGLAVLPDELGAWLDGHRRYAKTSERVDWLRLYSNSMVVVDRKTKADENDPDSCTFTLWRPAVSLLGGIPPACLARQMDEQEQENGMLARMLLVGMNDGTQREAEVVDLPREVDDGVRDVFVHLDAIGGPPADIESRYWPRLQMTAEALSRWRAHYRETEHSIKSLPDGLERRLWSKLQGATLRFALILHCVKRVSSEGQVNNWTEMPVELETLEDAIELVSWAGNETIRVYNQCGLLAALEDEEDGVASGALSKAAVKFVDKMHEKGVQECTVRDVYRSIHGGRLADGIELATALVAAGLAKWAEDEQQTRGVASGTKLILTGQ
jgi:hypothetical protein